MIQSTAICSLPGAASISQTQNTMSGSQGQTPRVFFTLDKSEILRLSKLRETLKLSHWNKIGGEYELEVSETVEKEMKALLVTDPMEHDRRYSHWDNRYSDFTLSWAKTKDPVSHEIIGHLFACGAPRIKDLGMIGEGCRASIMRGPILHQPLPTTSVGDLRVNHLQMRVEFTVPWKAEGNASESKSYTVGRGNKLFGKELRRKNKQKFVAEQEAKRDPVTKEFLTDLFAKLGDVALKAAGAAGGGDRPHIDEDDKLTGASHSQLRSSNTSSGGNVWTDIGPDDLNYHHSFQSSGQQGAIDTCKSMVGPKIIDPTSSGAKEEHPISGASSLDGHETVPGGSSDEDNQVRLQNIGGKTSPPPPPIPVVPQPIPPAEPRVMALRNKKLVNMSTPVPSPAKIKALQDKRHALNKSNNQRHKAKFADSGSMSN